MLILSPINCSIQLMTQKGAGKTTLLNCLTGKLRKGVSGHINLKGANGKHLKMCTIPQKDHLLEQLTVEENLWFASKIKNPEYGFDHVKNIERVSYFFLIICLPAIQNITQQTNFIFVQSYRSSIF